MATEIPSGFANTEAAGSTTAISWTAVGPTLSGVGGTPAWVTGRKYLIVASGMIGNDGDIEQAGLRVAHDGTPFTESDFIVTPASAVADSKVNYFWFTVWSGTAGETIRFEAQTSNAATPAKFSSLQLIALEISEHLVENTDWFWNELPTDSGALPNTFVVGASVNFTPAIADHRYLSLSFARYTSLTTTINVEHKVIRVGSTESLVSREGENNSVDRMVQGTVEVFQLPASSQTLRCEDRSDQGGGSTERTHSAIFVLDLDALGDGTASPIGLTQPADVLDLSATDYATEIASLPVAPTVSTPYLILGYFAADHNGGNYVKWRIQKDGADFPGATPNEPRNKPWDSTDQNQAVHLGKDTISASTTYDFDASSEGGAPEARNIVLLALPLVVPGGGGQDRTFQAAVDVLASITAELKTERTLGAALDATADLTALLSADRPLSAALEATADLQAALAAERPLEAAVDVASDWTFDLDVERTLQAALDATSDWAAELTTAADKLFEAAVQATADIQADLDVERPLVAPLDASADWMAAIDIERELVLALDATSDWTADLTVDGAGEVTFQAAVDVLADWSSALSLDRNFEAALVADGNLAASLSAERPLLAALQATVDFDAAIARDRILAAALDATIDFDTALEREPGFAAAIDVTTDWIAGAMSVDRNFVAALEALATFETEFSKDQLFKAGKFPRWNVRGTDTWRQHNLDRAWRP